MSETRRISVWSGPRNISTALMYSFRQRPDTTVVDEPLYGHYLATTGLRHPGYEAVLENMEHDAERVLADVFYGPCPTPVLFMKNMAHHLVGLDLGGVAGVTNVLLTRDPREMLVSLTREIPDADLDATGLPAQVRLLEHLEARGETPAVLEARIVLEDPRGVLRALCHRLGLAWHEAMLHWSAGPKPEDGVWAPYWYDSVHGSTGFAPYRPKTEPFPEHLEPLLAACVPLYERLIAHALRA